MDLVGVHAGHDVGRRLADGDVLQNVAGEPIEDRELVAEPLGLVDEALITVRPHVVGVVQVDVGQAELLGDLPRAGVHGRDRARLGLGGRLLVLRVDPHFPDSGLDRVHRAADGRVDGQRGEIDHRAAGQANVHRRQVHLPLERGVGVRVAVLIVGWVRDEEEGPQQPHAEVAGAGNRQPAEERDVVPDVESGRFGIVDNGRCQHERMQLADEDIEAGLGERHLGALALLERFRLIEGHAGRSRRENQAREGVAGVGLGAERDAHGVAGLRHCQRLRASGNTADAPDALEPGAGIVGRLELDDVRLGAADAAADEEHHHGRGRRQPAAPAAMARRRRGRVRDDQPHERERHGRYQRDERLANAVIEEAAEVRTDGGGHGKGRGRSLPQPGIDERVAHDGGHHERGEPDGDEGGARDEADDSAFPQIHPAEQAQPGDHGQDGQRPGQCPVAKRVGKVAGERHAGPRCP